MDSAEVSNVEAVQDSALTRCGVELLLIATAKHPCFKR